MIWNVRSVSMWTLSTGRCCFLPVQNCRRAVLSPVHSFLSTCCTPVHSLLSTCCTLACSQLSCRRSLPPRLLLSYHHITYHATTSHHSPLCICRHVTCVMLSVVIVASPQSSCRYFTVVTSSRLSHSLLLSQHHPNRPVAICHHDIITVVICHHSIVTIVPSPLPSWHHNSCQVPSLHHYDRPVARCYHSITTVVTSS